ncbi:adenylate/guanylate cyclase domain-containing protein [Mycolicibacterium thermoresistibile]|jgi:adenylate cyclase|uniref:Adenylyl cyclase n=2 Tax=Mycolicibacterium thermoresistibile TaxID=1797 RepID=A0A100XEB0_MYCTH|nr:adenylate/guanylate cyclase domain-containing protein [Mycolicibacterium thermoresistibile]EHI14699.1 putative adenylate/guanylate cyclase [Mycolicibacterium thermoresistibile ATCC 19527]MCV7189232.1 adenylate/guanylate cyclase domain-containing protein [Mycolicibacterium thermoresistibile]GAT15002.1 adenylyl cyclase [Mycolicibacterium thermoresistibile]SNW19465.1 family 3 adenylate cyclase [Mycolicibacterium thermoresistibile]
MADDVDIEASGLLDDLTGEAREQRAELIAWLIERGYSIEEIRESVSPMLLASRRLIGDDSRYVSAAEISRSTGMDLGLLQRMLRALGLPRVDDPDAVVHLRADAEAAARAQRFIEAGVDPDQMVQIAAVLSEGLAKAAELMRSTVVAAVLQPGKTELQIAQDAEALVRRLAPLLGPMIQDLLLLQLRHAMETEAVSVTERAQGVPLPGARLVSIAFADLVGFTRLGEAVPPEELEQLAARLADLAREVAEPPVRFIKTIGDAVMLVSVDPAELLAAMLELIDGTGADQDFPRVRAGMATGMAVSRAGDWYGSPVNLASRVTGVARPGSVLVAEATREAIGDDERFRWSFAGSRRLKGIKGEVKLYRARRAE